MSCELAVRDGAHVLGSLSPTERKEFEQHLTGCKECARNVRQLAGLPGLLARVDRAVLEDPDVAVPVPDTLLPALVRDVRRVGRRRTLVTAGLAAAAAVVVVGVPLAVSGVLEGDRTPSAAPASRSAPSTSAAPSTGTATTVGGASLAAATTSAVTSPGNSAGVPVAMAASCSPTYSVVWATGSAASNASPDVSPSTCHSRAPARATTSRSLRVLATGKRRPRPAQTYDVGRVSLSTTAR